MYVFQDPNNFQMHHHWSYSVKESSCHHLCGCQAFSCIMTISKGSMTPTRDTWASRSSTRVPSLHQVINYYIITFKGTRTINPSNVGPRDSSGIIHQARGFIGFFHHTRRPLGSISIMTSHVGLLDLLLGYHELNKHKWPLKGSFGLLELL